MSLARRYAQGALAAAGSQEAGDALAAQIELFVQTVAQDTANAARVQVTVLADVRLNRVRQGQRITVVAQPEA